MINDYDILFISVPGVINHNVTDNGVYDPKVTNHSDSALNNITVYGDSAAKRFSMDVYVLFVVLAIALVLPSLVQYI